MKIVINISKAFIVFCLSFSSLTQAKVSIDNWAVNTSHGLTIFTTRGATVYSHDLGIAKMPEDCSIDHLIVHYTSYDNSIKDIEGKNVIVKFSNKQHSFDAELLVVNVKNATKRLSIVSLTTSDGLTSNMKKMLNSEEPLTVEIVSPLDIAKKFDIAEEYFVLENYKKAYALANKQCLGVN
ncbi:Uncharacterised protein [Shewanella baltica]|nr:MULTISPECIES: hypothetical protein [Shewanella]MCK7635830.1 hypothetical protein [Shewanella sp. JNE17]MCK7651001.1 hypothetical protein [Shewanella sp. JNE8]MCK7659205.1 hypothetical protein [Shewanella sp. JNE4-2]UPO32572.1 hypothetical protein MZ182_06970 [Shewanella sp. JNE2]VEF26647.1 Uncharacterised protein [Shewanella baltica]